MILSKTELKNLNKGRQKKITVEVRKHVRTLIFRSPQAIKDKTIEEFAIRWLTQIERRGVTDADKRHAKALVRLMKEYKLL